MKINVIEKSLLIPSLKKSLCNSLIKKRENIIKVILKNLELLTFFLINKIIAIVAKNNIEVSGKLSIIFSKLNPFNKQFSYKFNIRKIRKIVTE